MFGHHHDVIDGVAEGLKEYGTVKLDGRMKKEHRQESIDSFQGDPTIRVFVGSIQAAGVGITLTAASTVVFAELDWVPGNVSQAEDRLHRIGQHGSVLVQHLVVDESIDARLAKAIVEKQRVIDAALDDPTGEARKPLNALGVLFEEEMEKEKARAKVNAEREEERRKEEADYRLTPEQEAAIQLGLRKLAGMCDGASKLDEAGFSKLDVGIGHSLAEGITSRRGYKIGARLIRKYRRQVPEEYEVVHGTA